MAKFEEKKVINALHTEKAEVGKKYWFAENIFNLKKYVEENNVNYTGKLTKSKTTDESHPFYSEDEINWQFLYPYEEPPKQRMTNIQLMEWISKRNGIFQYKGNDYCSNCRTCAEWELNEEVEKDIVIRTWDNDEWIEPTVEIYERDCKGDKNNGKSNL